MSRPSQLVAEQMQREADRRRNQPEAFAALSKDEAAALLLLDGLKARYIECVSTGKIDVWAACAKGVVELLSDPMAKFERRP